MIQVRKDELTHPEVQALLAYHHGAMHADSPPGHAFALNLDGLRTPDITVWTAWRDGVLAGMGALRRIDAEVGEIKSMRTHPDHLRLGVGAAVLEAIVTEGRAIGLRRLSLETGDGAAFEPALALYRRRGFTDGPAFGDYQASAFNQFLHLDL